MKIAAVTMVYNERHFLPMWIAHYGAAFGRENLYVVDDGSTDSGTTGLNPVNVAVRAKLDNDEDRRAQMMSELHSQLLTRYDAVIFSDVDELVVVDPRLGKSLARYITEDVPDYVTLFGFNVIFDPTREAALDPALPLLAQRNLVQFDLAYCKSLVSRVPIRWLAGFHRASLRRKCQRDLYLFHLRAVDRAIAAERIRNFGRVPLSENSRRRGLSLQFQQGEEAYIASFFPEPAAYASATPEDGFDDRVDSIYAALLNRDTEQMQLAHGTFLRLPPRFRDAIRLS